MTTSFVQASESFIPTTQDTHVLRQVLASLSATSCPRQYNFHMHTTCSDGRLNPEQLMEQAVDIGLRGLAITDHHSTKGFHRAQRWLETHGEAYAQERRPSGDVSLPHLWTGIEISAGLMDDEVHILCYGFNPHATELKPYVQSTTPTGQHYSAASVIEAAHAAGAVTVLAHPARYRRSPDELIARAVELGIDGVEAYYAYNNPDPWTPSPKQTADVKTLSDRYGLLNTCGTDTHGLSLLKRL